MINLSADTLAEADELASLNIGPVVVVLDAQDGTQCGRCDARWTACGHVPGHVSR